MIQMINIYNGFSGRCSSLVVIIVESSCVGLLHVKR
jgi:hypothetical protein